MMKHHKLISGVIMLLTAGIISGGIAGYILGRYYSPEPQSLREIRNRLFYIMKRDLKLSSEQQIEVGKILDKSMLRLAKFRIKNAPELLMIIKANNDELLAILNSKQRAIYENYRKERLKLIKDKLFEKYE
jgi:hypothetical protein